MKQKLGENETVHSRLVQAAICGHLLKSFLLISPARAVSCSLSAAAGRGHSSTRISCFNLVIIFHLVAASRSNLSTWDRRLLLLAFVRSFAGDDSVPL